MTNTLMNKRTGRPSKRKMKAVWDFAMENPGTVIFPMTKERKAQVAKNKRVSKTMRKIWKLRKAAK